MVGMSAGLRPLLRSAWRAQAAWCTPLQACNLRAPLQACNVVARCSVRSSARSAFTTAAPPLPHLGVPPFALRVALVGASTSLATPVLTVVGAVVWWHRAVSACGKGVTVVSFVLLGGGIVRIVYEYVAPFTSKHGDLVAPFALANGLAAATCYAALELRFGLQVRMGQTIECFSPIFRRFL